MRGDRYIRRKIRFACASIAELLHIEYVVAQVVIFFRWLGYFRRAKRKCMEGENRLFFLWSFHDESAALPPKALKNISRWQRKDHNLDTEIKYYRGTALDMDAKLRRLSSCYRTLCASSDIPPQYASILRYDLARYIYAYHEGKSYSDLDVIPRLSVSDVWDDFPDKHIVLGVEKTYTSLSSYMEVFSKPATLERVESNFRIANYLLFCRSPYHPFWKDLLENIEEAMKTYTVTNDRSIIDITGPGMLTYTLWHRISRYADIGIIPGYIFSKYFRHTCASSWRQDYL